MKTVREAAHALCDRWDTMEWKDAEHTSVFVHELRTALAQPEPFTPDWASYRQGKEDGQREWVSLTGDDMDNIARVAMDVSDSMLLTEAKLKELNHD
jgi:hypothetical protein